MTQQTMQAGFSQPADFRDESDALSGLLSALGDDDFNRRTRFKQWTIAEIITHLHVWNWAAEQALADEEALVRLVADFIAQRDTTSLREFEKRWVGALSDRSLVDAWRIQYRKTADRFQQVDPRIRTKWFGPEMSARSNITARLMETWAHGQAIYDLLGARRIDTDRIRNVAVLGVQTFEWTFKTHRQALPKVKPHVRLTGPSGAIWTWNEESQTDLIVGSAVEFCQVVTQVRNIADTGLKVGGESAQRWMRIAQCFAGLPEKPPAPGERFRERVEG